MKELTTRQALEFYGIGGLTAFAGWFSQMVLLYTMATLFIMSIFLTFGEGGN